MREQRQLQDTDEEAGLTGRGTGLSGGDEMALTSGIGIFGSGDFELAEHDANRYEDGYESKRGQGSLGIDYRITENVVAGMVGSVGDTHGDYSNGGDFRVRSYGVTGFASVMTTGGLFVDATLGYAFKDYNFDRALSVTSVGGFGTITGTGSGDTNGHEYSAGVSGGYDFVFGNITVGPRVGVDYVSNTIRQFSERGNTGMELVFNERDSDSLQTSVGVAMTAAYSTNFGVLVPQLDFEYVHEFKDNQRTYTARFVQDLRPTPLTFAYGSEKPDRDFFNLGVSVAALLADGVAPFASFQTRLADDNLATYGVALGLRLEL
jgi:outer membrane autotransporter protein